MEEENEQIESAFAEQMRSASSPRERNEDQKPDEAPSVEEPRLFTSDSVPDPSRIPTSELVGLEQLKPTEEEQQVPLPASQEQT